jgi:osmotically-inducible protein OsmY
MFNLFEKKDTEIQEDVIQELKWDPSITSEQITVTAKDGIVTLRGSVPHYYEKSAAEIATQRVGGVRAVADEIEVNIMGSYERSDSDIAEAALIALKWSYAVPQGIKVVVDKGWITLKGETEWDYQRQAAKNAVSQLMGVTGVSNEITLVHNMPQVNADEVKQNILDAFKRSAKTEGNNIEIKIKGNQVTLYGDVHSYTEIEDATFAAWCSPGVLRVENNLIITN